MAAELQLKTEDPWEGELIMNRFLATMSVVTLFSGLSLVANAQDKSKDKPTGSYESKSTNTTTTDSGTTKTTTGYHLWEGRRVPAR